MRFLIIPLIAFSSFTSAQELSVKLSKITNATNDEITHHEKSLALVQKVVNSEKFKNRVLNMKYQIGRYIYDGYSQTQDTSAEVLQKIKNTQEIYNNEIDHTLEFYIDVYYEESSTVGWTNYYDKFIHLNRYFHQDYSHVQTAGNHFHEWLHKIGYDHSRRNNSFRPHSVPYKLGSLMSELAAESESNGDPVFFNLLKDNFFDYQCSSN